MSSGPGSAQDPQGWIPPSPPPPGLADFRELQAALGLGRHRPGPHMVFSGGVRPSPLLCACLRVRMSPLAMRTPPHGVRASPMAASPRDDVQKRA